MRLRCTRCDVEWTSTRGEPVRCWMAEPGEDHLDTIGPAFEVPAWAWGYTHLQALYRDRVS